VKPPPPIEEQPGPEHRKIWSINLVFKSLDPFQEHKYTTVKTRNFEMSFSFRIKEHVMHDKQAYFVQIQ
jgi:hypothetical protein